MFVWVCVSRRAHARLQLHALASAARAALDDCVASRAPCAYDVGAYHYTLPTLPHAITLRHALRVPPHGAAAATDAGGPLLAYVAAEEAGPRLTGARADMHSRLGLPRAPLLRLAAALPPTHYGPALSARTPGVLDCVHVGAPGPTVRGGGATTAVQGSYEYFHYMQQRFNDKVCVCARARGLRLCVVSACVGGALCVRVRA